MNEEKELMKPDEYVKSKSENKVAWTIVRRWNITIFYKIFLYLYIYDMQNY